MLHVLFSPHDFVDSIEEKETSGGVIYERAWLLFIVA